MDDYQRYADSRIFGLASRPHLPFCVCDHLHPSWMPADVHSICVGTSLMVILNSLLTEPLWSGHGGDTVYGFKFHDSLHRMKMTNKIADRRTVSVAWSPAVQSSLLSPTTLASFGVTKIKKCGYSQLQYRPSEPWSALWSACDSHGSQLGCPLHCHRRQ